MQHIPAANPWLAAGELSPICETKRWVLGRTSSPGHWSISARRCPWARRNTEGLKVRADLLGKGLQRQ
jgi:hypothetical protein